MIQSFITFQPHSTKPHKQIIQKLERDYVHIFQKEKNQFKIILPQIQQWNVKILKLFTQCNSLVIEIRNIKFPSLKQLFIQQNIQSFEGLSRVYLPILEELYILYNKIISLREFKKAHWPMFKYISMRTFAIKEEGNHIVDGHELTKMHISSMNQFNNQFWDNDVEQGPDIRWVVKLECPKLTYLRIQSLERIKQPKAEEAIRQRFSLTKLYSKQ